MSLTGCSHRCRHQKVWIHSSLKVKPKQKWTPWYTEMQPQPHTPTQAGTAAPASLNSTAYEMEPLFPDCGAVWECSGVDYSLQGAQAVSVGKCGSPCGIHSRGGHTKLCSQSLQWPLLSTTIPCLTALAQINACLLGNADLLISPARGDCTATPEQLLSQSDMKFSFLQSFSLHSHVCFGELQS